MRRSNRGGEFDKGVLYACLEILQWNSCTINILCLKKNLKAKKQKDAIYRCQGLGWGHGSSSRVPA
jgi:hypothetical protein